MKIVREALLAGLLLAVVSTAAHAAAPVAPAATTPPAPPPPSKLVSHEFTKAQNGYVVIWHQETDRDKDGKRFLESHTATFRCSWVAASKLATEEITHVVVSTADRQSPPAETRFRVTATCPSDPWMNEKVTCTDWKKEQLDQEKAPADASDFFLSAPNPKSAQLLGAREKKALRDEYASAKATLKAGPSAVAGTPPAPKPASTAAVPKIAPAKVLSPKGGEVVQPETFLRIQVQLPQGAPGTTCALEFEAKEGGAWVRRSLLDGYDTASSPQGLDVRQENFPVAGEWRVRARVDRSEATWSDWVVFRIQ
jgi:hypothetical protein